jgi:multiple RNA-binding domain-containing protein 1
MIAIRIALGETHIIAETKKFLSRSGVNVAALEEHASKRNDKFKRSNYVILVKNLPFNSTEEELATLFQKHGSLDKMFLFIPEKQLPILYIAATYVFQLFLYIVFIYCSNLCFYCT